MRAADARERQLTLRTESGQARHASRRFSQGPAQKHLYAVKQRVWFARMSLLRVVSRSVRILALLCCSLYGSCVRFDAGPFDLSAGGLLGLLIAYEPDARIVILGSDGNGYRSSDGISWVPFRLGNALTIHKVIWTGARFVAVGTDTNTRLAATFRSIDGKAWTPGQMPSPSCPEPAVLCAAGAA